MRLPKHKVLFGRGGDFRTSLVRTMDLIEIFRLQSAQVLGLHNLGLRGLDSLADPCGILLGKRIGALQRDLLLINQVWSLRGRALRQCLVVTEDLDTVTFSSKRVTWLRDDENALHRLLILILLVTTD